MMHSRSPAQLCATLLVMLVMLVSSACSLQKKPPVTRDQATVDYNLLLTLPAEPLSFKQSVRPVLENRCVAGTRGTCFKHSPGFRYAPSGLQLIEYSSHCERSAAIS
jgi:hypothetical protein